MFNFLQQTLILTILTFLNGNAAWSLTFLNGNVSRAYINTRQTPIRPNLAYNFMATVNISRIYNGKQSISSLTKIGVIHVDGKPTQLAKEKNDSPFNKTIKILECNGIINGYPSQSSISQFFNEGICIRSAIPGSPVDTDLSHCIEHQLGEFMPIWQVNSTYINSTFNGSEVFDGVKVNIWRANTVHTNTFNISGKPPLFIHSNTTWDYYVTDSGEIRKINVSTNEIQKQKGKPDKHMYTEVYTHFLNYKSPPDQSFFEVPDGIKCYNVIESSCTSRLPTSSFLKELHWSHGITWDSAAPHKGLRAFINDADYIKQLNQNMKTWTAGVNKVLIEPTRLDEVSSSLKTWIDTEHFLNWMKKKGIGGQNALAKISSEPIPESFDSRVHWSNCTSIGRVRNQGYCGSCWAFGAVESMEDRICIASNGAVQVTLSAEYLVDCDKYGLGCHGGYMVNAWDMLLINGTVTEKCDPYQHCDYPSSPHCTAPSIKEHTVEASIVELFLDVPINKCPIKCTDGTSLEPSRYKLKDTYAVAEPCDVTAIQRELMTSGPVEVDYTVYRDFYQYISGVYRASQDPTNKIAGGHAVKLIGWGTDAIGGDYWLVTNSWSPNWGEKGFFRIARGINECGIENNALAGTPVLKNF